MVSVAVAEWLIPLLLLDVKANRLGPTQGKLSSSAGKKIMQLQMMATLNSGILWLD
jgi:hypothetical protein